MFKALLVLVVTAVASASCFNFSNVDFAQYLPQTSSATLSGATSPPTTTAVQSTTTPQPQPCAGTPQSCGSGTTCFNCSAGNICFLGSVCIPPFDGTPTSCGSPGFCMDCGGSFCVNGACASTTTMTTTSVTTFTSTTVPSTTQTTATSSSATTGTGTLVSTSTASTTTIVSSRSSATLTTTIAPTTTPTACLNSALSCGNPGACATCASPKACVSNVCTCLGTASSCGTVSSCFNCTSTNANNVCSNGACQCGNSASSCGQTYPACSACALPNICSGNVCACPSGTCGSSCTDCSAGGGICSSGTCVCGGTSSSCGDYASGFCRTCLPGVSCVNNRCQTAPCNPACDLGNGYSCRNGVCVCTGCDGCGGAPCCASGACYHVRTHLSITPRNCSVRLTSRMRGFILETSDHHRIRLTGKHLVFSELNGEEVIMPVDHLQVSDVLFLEGGNQTRISRISREAEEQQYFALDCPRSSNLIAYANGIKTYTDPVASRRTTRQVCNPPAHPFCPSSDFLDALNATAAVERMCWELFSTISPYASFSNYFLGNISQWSDITSRIVNASTSGNPSLYQLVQYQKRENLQNSWRSFLLLDSHLSRLVSSVDCSKSRGCFEYVSYLQTNARQTIAFMRPDLIVSPASAALSITIYILLLAYLIIVASLALFYFKSLFAAKMKYYTVIAIGIALVIFLRIIWWSFMWSGMGPQYAVPSLAGRIVFRVGTIIFFWCIVLFLSLWLRVCFSTFYESPFLLRLSTGILVVVALGGTVAAIVMGVLTEYGGSVDVTNVLLSFLELIACSLALALTGMTLFKLASEKSSTFEKQRKGLMILITVEGVLICAFIIQLVVAFYVLFVPPLVLQDWISYFVVVTLPDSLAFGAVTSLLAINYKTARKLRPASSFVTRSTSVTGTNEASEVEMRIPERYKE
jgi:hypothetical protein